MCVCLSCCSPLQENASRLKAYKSMLVVFPRRSKKPKAGDASREELQAVDQHTGPILPIEPDTMQQLETTSISDELKVRPFICCALSSLMHVTLSPFSPFRQMQQVDLLPVLQLVGIIPAIC